MSPANYPGLIKAILLDTLVSFFVAVFLSMAITPMEAETDHRWFGAAMAGMLASRWFLKIWKDFYHSKSSNHTMWPRKGVW